MLPFPAFLEDAAIFPPCALAGVVTGPDGEVALETAALVADDVAGVGGAMGTSSVSCTGAGGAGGKDTVSGVSIGAAAFFSFFLDFLTDLETGDSRAVSASGGTDGTISGRLPTLSIVSSNVGAVGVVTAGVAMLSEAGESRTPFDSFLTDFALGVAGLRFDEDGAEVAGVTTPSG